MESEVPGWQLLETTNVIQERPHFLLILLFHFSGPTQRNRMPFILPEINTDNKALGLWPSLCWVRRRAIN